MSKRFFTTLVFGLILVPFLMGTGFAKTLKIGSMGPLTGPYASDGVDIANGVRTAIEVIESEGGIPGFDKIELFPMDTACDPKQAVASANKLVNVGVVGVIGAYCSSSTIPASEVLIDEDIIMITPASTHQDVTDRGLEYMFRMCGRDDAQAPAAGAFIKNALKAKTIFIVDDKTTYSQGLADGIRAYSEANGIKVLAHEHVNQGDKDFSAVITMAKRENADIFYMSLQNHSPASLMTIQAKRMKLKSQIISQDACYSPNYTNVAKTAAEGVFVTYGFTDKEAPSFKKYEKLFTEKYGKVGAYGTYAYDGAMSLMMAIKNAKSTDPAKIKAEMMKLDYQGASKHVKFSSNGDSGSAYIAYKIVNGEYVPYWHPEKGLY